MSKAVLVMNMPSSCFKFPLGKNMSNSIEVCIQCPLGKCVVDVETETIPDWCPLSELPKKKLTIGKESDNDILCMNAGYNACIDELLKGEGVH